MLKLRQFFRYKNDNKRDSFAATNRPHLRPQIDLVYGERSTSHVAHVRVYHVAHVTITHVAHVTITHVAHVRIYHVAHVRVS